MIIVLCSYHHLSLHLTHPHHSFTAIQSVFHSIIHFFWDSSLSNIRIAQRCVKVQAVVLVAPVACTCNSYQQRGICFWSRILA